MGDFTVLPVLEGVAIGTSTGIVSSSCGRPIFSKQLLAQDFVANFPQYLTSSTRRC